MPNPKRRHSRSRQGKRRSHHALKPMVLAKCPRCGATVKPHCVCPNCEHYKGREYKISKAEGR